MGIFLTLLVILVGIIALTGIRIVNQSDVYLVEFLGKYSRQLNAGFNYIIPGLEHVRYRVSQKVEVLDSQPQQVITKDNVTMAIDTVTFYKVTDAFKASYEIANFKQAILNITATTLRDVIGSLELDETLSSRDAINTRLRDALDKATDAWGIKIERVEVKNITPPADIMNAMESQMRAERAKRASVLEAQGRKEAAILDAQGDQESQILKADGEAEAIKRLANAEEQRIRVVYGALKSADLDETILKLESIQALKAVAESDNKMVVPYESQQLMGAVSALKNLGK